MSSQRRLALLTLVGCVVLVAGLGLTAGAGVSESPPDEEWESSSTEATDEMNLTVWRGGQALADRVTDLSAVRAAMESGALVRSRTIIETETLVLELEAPGMASRLAEADGTNETTRFFDATSGEDSGLTLIQTREWQQRYDYAARLNSTAATTVVTDPANETYYLVTDPLALDVVLPADDYRECERCSPADLFISEGFSLNVTLDGTTHAFRTERDGDRRPDVRFVDADAMYEPVSDRGDVAVPATAGALVRATTNLRPGTNVTVRLTDRSDADWAIEARTAVSPAPESALTGDVSERGRITAALDARYLDPNATFDVELVVDGRVVEVTHGRPAHASVWRAPGSHADQLTTRTAIRTARRAGTLAVDRSVSVRDALVVRLWAPGLGSELDRDGTKNDTAAFFDALRENDGHVRFVEERATGDRRPLVAGLTERAATVVADDGNDTYYVVADPAEMRLGRATDGGVNWDATSSAWLHRSGDLALEVSTGESVPPYDGGFYGDRPSVRFASGDAAVAEKATEPFEPADRITLNGTANETLHARTTLSPGTRVTVRLANRSDGGDPIAVQTTVDRQPDPFADSPRTPLVATVDATGLATNATFDVQVNARGDRLTSVGGERRGGANEDDGTERTPTASPTEQTARATPTASPTPTETDASPTPTRSDQTPTAASGSSSTRTASTATGTSGSSTASTTTPTTGDAGPGFGLLAAVSAFLVMLASAIARKR